MRIDLSRNMLNSIFFILLGEKCLNTEFFLVRILFSCIRTEYRKIRTRKNFVFGHFSRSGYFPCLNTSSWDRKRSTILNFSLYIIIKGMLHCLTFLRSGPPELPGKRFSESFRAYLNVSVHQFKAANEQGY